MYRNSRLAILLAAAVVLGLLLGRYLGRNTPEAQLRNLVEQLTHPTNKLARSEERRVGKECRL